MPICSDPVTLKYFSKAEFGLWWDRMEASLLYKLDTLRMLLDRPIHISPHHDSLGRHLDNSYSLHNVDRWFAVKAADVFIEGLGVTPNNTKQQFAEHKFMFDAAKDAHFTGIGLYTDTHFERVPHTMMHVDVRPSRSEWPDNGGDFDYPATWSRVNGKYGSIDFVLP